MPFLRHDPVVSRLIDLGVARSAATRLSQGGTVLDLPAGTTLCTAGERGTQAFLLLEGEADVHTADGVIPVGPGAVIGELATLDPTRIRNATVVTTTPASVLVFDAPTFRAMAEERDLHDRLAPQRTAA